MPRAGDGVGGFCLCPPRALSGSGEGACGGCFRAAVRERGKGIHQPRLQVWVRVLDQVSKLFKKNRSWVR